MQISENICAAKVQMRAACVFYRVAVFDVFHYGPRGVWPDPFRKELDRLSALSSSIYWCSLSGWCIPLNNVFAGLGTKFTWISIRVFRILVLKQNSCNIEMEKSRGYTEILYNIWNTFKFTKEFLLLDTTLSGKQISCLKADNTLLIGIFNWDALAKY